MNYSQPMVLDATETMKMNEMMEHMTNDITKITGATFQFITHFCFCNNKHLADLAWGP